MYWFDSINFVKIIFLIIFLRVKMYIEIIEYIDSKKIIEIWHSLIWKFLIKTIFDNVLYNQRNEFIILNKIMQINNNKNFQCD